MAESQDYRRQTQAVRLAARAHLRQLRAARLARRDGVEAGGAGETEPMEHKRATGSTGSIMGAPAARLSVSRAASEAISALSAIDSLGPKEPMHEPLDAGPPLQGRKTPAAEVEERELSVDTSQTRAEEAIEPSETAPEWKDRSSTAGDTARESGPQIEDGRRDASSTALPTAGEPASPGPAMTEAEPARREEQANAIDPDAKCASTEAGSLAESAVASDESERSDLETLPGAGIGLVWMLQRCGVTSLSDLAEADADRLRTQMGLVGELLDLPGWIAFARQKTGSPCALPPK